MTSATTRPACPRQQATHRERERERWCLSPLSCRTTMPRLALVTAKSTCRRVRPLYHRYTRHHRHAPEDLAGGSPSPSPPHLVVIRGAEELVDEDLDQHRLTAAGRPGDDQVPATSSDDRHEPSPRLSLPSPSASSQPPMPDLSCSRRRSDSKAATASLWCVPSMDAKEKGRYLTDQSCMHTSHDPQAGAVTDTLAPSRRG